MTKQTMTAPAVDQAAKAHFLKKYLRQEPGETELVWDRLLATGMVVLIPAGKRVAHYKLAPLPKAKGDMTPTEALQRAGEALFGAQWQSEIGRALGVTDRTVRRWVSGENNMPDDIKPRLRTLIDTRIVDLHTVRLRLLP